MAQILVIDDSKLARVQVRRMLNNTSYEVIEASSGEEGIEAAVNSNPDCVLLDLLMPGMKGTEVLKIFKEREINIPVIVFTANVQKTKIEECHALGASVVITKPKERDELLPIIENLLKGDNKE